MKARPADFDMAALHAALDAKRRALGLSWAGARRQIIRPDAVPVLHPISVSSVTGTGQGRGVEGNIVLQMLAWLDRTPESFVPGYLAPTTPRTQLPEAPADRRLQGTSQHFMALHAALDARRRERGMSCKQVAEEMGGFHPGHARRSCQGPPCRLPRA
jgi:hypothetical protein